MELQEMKCLENEDIILKVERDTDTVSKNVDTKNYPTLKHFLTSY